MSRPRVAVPLFPNPPKEYSQRYMADMQRVLAQFAQAVLTPGEARATFMVLTDLQEDDYLLETGALYKNGNELKITVDNVASLRGAHATSSVGALDTTP